MCGIFCTITCKGCKSNAEDEFNEAELQTTRCTALLQRRGPDSLHEAKADVGDVSCHLIGCVLWMQGQRPTPQPIADERGNLLLWNGEIFNEPWPREVGSSDSLALSQMLSRTDRSAANFLGVLSSVRGPFAFAYLDVERGRLWFGRDRIGRHSLLWHRDVIQQLSLSSVAGAAAGWREVGAEGVYCAELVDDLPVTLYPWSDITPALDGLQNDVASLVSPTTIASPLADLPSPCSALPPDPPEDVREMFERFAGSPMSHGEILDALATDRSTSLQAARLVEAMKLAVKVRVDTQPGLCRLCTRGGECQAVDGCRRGASDVIHSDPCPARESLEAGTSPVAACTHPKIAVLFSGGLDSAVLAALADVYVPRRDPIDLLNVAFQRSRPAPAKTDPKRQHDKIKRKRDKRQRDRERHEAGDGIGNTLCDKNNAGSERGLLNNVAHCQGSINFAMDALNYSLDRESILDDMDTTESNNLTYCNRFGGGIEPERHRLNCGRPIERLEVGEPDGRLNGDRPTADEHKEMLTGYRLETDECSDQLNTDRLGVGGPEDEVNGDRDREYDVPDRKTGLQTLEELRRVFPDRQWNFVEVNVTREELAAERSSRISDLISPLDTILDDSLGCALWFAARGRGRLDGADYTSPARVLLLGMGADEQLGGYMRHRTALSRPTAAGGGWSRLAAQLAADTGNIATRNLGRDDRVVSDSGRQGRLPYLDEGVVTLLGGLQPWQKCYPVAGLPPGVGDKYLLRLAARSIGFLHTSTLPKRAMQFGSRIAHSREKGGDRCDRLRADDR